MPPAFDPYYKWLGIPADEQPADHYRLLGLRRFESDPEVIQAAADRQMAHVRNYANGPHGELSQRLLNEIAAAKLQLLESPKKAAYDQSLRVATPAASPPQPARPTANSLPVATPLPTSPAPTAVDDIAPFDAPASLKRPGRKTTSKSTSTNLYLALAGSALTIVAVAMFLVSRNSDPPRTAKSNTPTTTPPAKSTDKPAATAADDAPQPKHPAEHAGSASADHPAASVRRDSIPAPAESVSVDLRGIKPKSPATGVASPPSTKAKELVGRFVRIELPRTATLTLAEVEVESQGRNIARQGKATQKNTEYFGDANRAIDGNKNGDWAAEGQSTTAIDTDNPWWELDLGDAAPIDSITVYNRTDSGLANRLEGFSLIVLDSNRKELLRLDRMAAPQRSVNIDFRGKKPKSPATVASDAPPANPKAVNLFKYVDTQSDSFQRDWKLDGAALVSLPGPLAHRRLPLLYSVPDEYDVKVVAERQGAVGYLGWGLWSGNSQVMVSVDMEWAGHHGAGLTKIDGLDWYQNNTFVSAMFLKVGVPSTISCSVRKQGIAVEIDGKRIIDWKGERSQLSGFAGMIITTSDQIELRTDGEFKVTKLELIPYSGQSTRPTGSQPTLPSKPAIVKLPVPNAAAQRESLRLIKEEYRSTYEKAKTPEKRFALAKKLYSASQSSTSKPSRCYALLREAADLAADVGQAQDAMVAINELVRRYEVDGVALQSDVLLAAAKNVRDPDGQKYLVDQASLGIEQALAAERFDVASKLMKLALAAAAKSKDPELLKQVRDGGKRLEEMQASFRKTEGALAALKKNPDDPEANLLAGKFFCFAKDDWPRGLPFLAKGSDAALADLAARDVANPASAEEQVKLADGWWDAAEADKAQPGKLKSRAAHWYEQALPDLQGSEQGRVNKRLEESDARAVVVYLDDLDEQSFSGHYRTPAKHGATNFRNPDKIIVDGKTPGHSLMTTPKANGTAHIGYQLDGKYQEFAATCAVIDYDDAGEIPIVFVVVGDGNTLWRSRSIQGRANRVSDAQICVVNVARVQKLELVVECAGSNVARDAVWVAPRLSRQSSR